MCDCLHMPSSVAAHLASGGILLKLQCCSCHVHHALCYLQLREQNASAGGLDCYFAAQPVISVAYYVIQYWLHGAARTATLTLQDLAVITFM